MTKPAITAEDVVALMDADWHWKPEHRALVRALAAVRVAAEKAHDAWHFRGKNMSVVMLAMGELCEALARVDEIERGGE